MPVIFPDVENLTRLALNAAFAVRDSGVVWHTKVPKPRPDEFGVVMRTGGSRETMVTENAQITLEGWAQTEVRALAILNLGRGIVFEFDGTLFGVTEIGGPVNLPDLNSSQCRYTATLGVRARGTVTA